MTLMQRIDQWLEKHLGEHLSFGPVTVFGFNAMHCAIQIWTRRWGYICFHPSLRFLGPLAPWMLGKDWPWCFYLSPNATPWAATLSIGPGIDNETKLRARERARLWGHGYSTELHDPQEEEAP